MATIRVKTKGQKLVRVDCPRIASGDKNIDHLAVDFCGDWNGYRKTAIFYREKNKPYYATPSDDGTYLIPWEVLQTGGLFHFGILGEDGERRKTSEIISYMIAEGVTTENLRPSDPTTEIPKEYGLITYNQDRTITIT